MVRNTVSVSDKGMVRMEWTIGSSAVAVLSAPAPLNSLRLGACLGGGLGKRSANMNDSHFSFVIDRATEVGDRINRV